MSVPPGPRTARHHAPRQHVTPAAAAAVHNSSSPRPPAVARTLAPSPELAARLLYRMRRQIGIGAALLAAAAGFANAVMLRLTTFAIGHMSGMTARVSIDAARGRFDDLAMTALILASFVAGAAVAGGITGTTQVRPGRRYAVVLWLEALTLAGATVAFARGATPTALSAGAFALGLQNGMASTFYGIVIRTTHLSGTLTDLGVLVGQWLRRQRVATWRIRFLGGIVVGFVAGGVTGAAAAGVFGPWALALPSASYAAGGTGYYVWIRHHEGDWALTRLFRRRRTRRRRNTPPHAEAA